MFYARQHATPRQRHASATPPPPPRHGARATRHAPPRAPRCATHTPYAPCTRAVVTPVATPRATPLRHMRTCYAARATPRHTLRHAIRRHYGCRHVFVHAATPIRHYYAVTRHAIAHLPLSFSYYAVMPPPWRCAAAAAKTAPRYASRHVSAIRCCQRAPTYTRTGRQQRRSLPLAHMRIRFVRFSARVVACYQAGSNTLVILRGTAYYARSRREEYCRQHARRAAQENATYAATARCSLHGYKTRCQQDTRCRRFRHVGVQRHASRRASALFCAPRYCL